MRCLLAVLLFACSGSGTQICLNGELCPEGRVCDEAHASCVLPEQLTVCRGMPDGTECEVVDSAGECDSGVCLLDIDARCGDGRLDEGEECDCGDGAIGVFGCDGPNSDDPNATCRTNCTASCGDGVISDNETCDTVTKFADACVGFGFDFGATACSDACAFDFSPCGSFLRETLVSPQGSTLEIVVGTSDRLFAMGRNPGNGTIIGPSRYIYERIAGQWLLLTGSPGYGGGLWVSEDGVLHQSHSAGLTSASGVSRLEGANWIDLPGHELFEGRTPKGIWGRSDSEIYTLLNSRIGTNSGYVLEFDGTAWSPTEVSGRLSKISGNSDTVIAVGEFQLDSYVACKTGETWTEMQHPGVRIRAVQVLDDAIYVAGSDGLLASYDCTNHTMDAIPLPAWLSDTSFNDIWTPDGETFFLTSRTLGTFFGGTSGWFHLPTGITTGVWGRSLTDVHLLTGTSDTFTVPWSSVAWTGAAFAQSMPLAARTLAQLEDGTSVVVAADAVSILSEDLQETTEPVPGAAGLRLVAGASASNFYVAGSMGGNHELFHNVDGVWTDLTADAGYPDGLRALKLHSKDGVLYVAGLAGGGNVLYSFDGSDWNDLETTIRVDGMWQGGDDELLVATADGSIRRVLAGQEWPEIAPTPSPVTAVWQAPGGAVFLGDDNGFVHRFDGSALTQLNEVGFGRILSIHGTSERDLFVTAPAPKLVHFDGTGFGPVRWDAQTGEVIATDRAVLIRQMENITPLVRTGSWASQ